MSLDDLNHAIALIKSGDKIAARKILERILQKDTGNVLAWVWLADTYPGITNRIAVLEECLKYNPDDPAVQKWLRAFKPEAVREEISRKESSSRLSEALIQEEVKEDPSGQKLLEHQTAQAEQIPAIRAVSVQPLLPPDDNEPTAPAETTPIPEAQAEPTPVIEEQISQPVFLPPETETAAQAESTPVIEEQISQPVVLPVENIPTAQAEKVPIIEKTVPENAPAAQTEPILSIDEEIYRLRNGSREKPIAAQAEQIPNAENKSFKSVNPLRNLARAISRFNQNPFTKTRKFRFLMYGLIAIALVIIGGLLELNKDLMGGQASSSGLPAAPAAPLPTLAPTPCPSASLTIGEIQFPIVPVKAIGDIPTSTSQGSSDSAYWLEGTDTNPVFILQFSSTDQARLDSLLSSGSASLAWSNCNHTDYSLGITSPGDPSDTALLDQSNSMITIFIPQGAGSAWSVVQGQPGEQTIVSVSTLDLSDMQADFTILGTTTSLDKSTITVAISINDYGNTSITLTRQDISLSPDDGTPATEPTNAKPSLPLTIKPGETKSIKFSFPLPAADTATLKIFSVELLLGDY